jgi:3-oxoacyl-[acyl-carrier-protein] synthase-3
MSQTALDGLTARLLECLRRVRDTLGMGGTAGESDARFADLLDSMGMVEFLVTLAEDFGVEPATIEGCVDRRFGTVAELAAAMQAAGIAPGGAAARLPGAAVTAWAAWRTEQASCWLGATAACLPETVQPAAQLDEALGRPAGWLESHAGIRQRRVWGQEDPLAAATRAAHVCLDQAGLPAGQVGALLVTSEAPPLYPGLAAALHHRLGLRRDTAALEIGGACTGYLAALWTAQAVLPRAGAALIVAVEAPTRWLRPQPGPAGEAAALFGDGAAASLLCRHPPGPEAVPLTAVVCGADGGAASLIELKGAGQGPVELHLEGEALAVRAVRTMAEAVRDLLRERGLTVGDLEGVVAHGGNGRMPALLARQLDLPPERVWSTTATTGNLGAASLPAAWAERRPAPRGLVAWTAVGAGLTWGAALTGIGTES